MTMVGYQGEMAMGIAAEPRGWLGSRQEFQRRWREAPQPVAIMRPEVFADYRKLGLPMRVIFENPRRIVVVKP
jgi:hypothetical protein